MLSVLYFITVTVGVFLFALSLVLYILIYIYRIRNLEAKHFMWRKKSLFKQQRLDFFLVSDTLQANIKAAGIIPAVQSDHSAITNAMPSF